jgi:hypothetical protein
MPIDTARGGLGDIDAMGNPSTRRQPSDAGAARRVDEEASGSSKASAQAQ